MLLKVNHQQTLWLKTPNKAFAARMCIVWVVVMNESNMAPYFPEAGNFNSSNADMCFNVVGLSMVGLSRSGSGDLFELWDRSNKIVSPTTSTYGHHLGFERGYNFHTTFRGICYVITHKVLLRMNVLKMPNSFCILGLFNNSTHKF